MATRSPSGPGAGDEGHEDPKDFLKLRIDEADKVRGGEKHFEVLNVPFAVVVTADEV